MFIWNPQNGGHDIRIKGRVEHQMKVTDFAAAIGTIPQKETIISTSINSKLSVSNNRMKTALHIESLSPLRYTVWCGPEAHVLPADWWDKQKEQKIDLVV